MSLLSDYEQRTSWKYEPVRGSFHTPEGLRNKVDEQGRYVPFCGSTVVFRAGKRERQVIQLMQQILMQKLEGTGMLADPLPASTTHMTLHDLCSPEMCPKDSPEAYAERVRDSLNRAAQVVEGIQRDFAGKSITLTADRIVNMVSKSLVLMLRPQTEQDYEMLMEMYRRFDGIMPLPYPLTPHITLGYFRPGMLDGDKLWEAMETAQVDPECAPVFTFDAESLTAQFFEDMKQYHDVPQRGIWMR